jgi:hypothetical protein
VFLHKVWIDLARSRYRLGLITTVILLLAACSVPQPTINSPLPTLASPLVSPLDTPGIPRPAIPIRLNKPILVGDNEVSGTGPAGLSIVISDITFMGDTLGAGAIQPDGTFTISVPTLEANHWIGVMVSDTSGTGWTMEDLYRPEFFGDEATQVPQVGFFHDSTLVREP